MLLQLISTGAILVGEVPIERATSRLLPAVTLLIKQNKIHHLCF
jgi:hypothetical protein